MQSIRSRSCSVSPTRGRSTGSEHSKSSRSNSPAPSGHGTWHEGEYAPWAVGWKAVAKTLGVDVNTGLTDAQVDAHAAYGSAALDLVEIPAWAPTFAEKLLESPISKAMLTLNTAAFAYNAAYDSVLGATVDFAVAGGVAFGMAAYAAYEDRGAARNDRAEQLAGVAQMNVLRAGVWVIKPSTDIVVGDVVKFTLDFDCVPCDVVVMSSNSGAVNESVYSGESNAAISKSPEAVAADVPEGKRSNFVCDGSIVMNGEIVGIVTAVGASTIIAQRNARFEANAAAEEPEEECPEKEEIDWLLGLVMSFSYAMAAVTLFLLHGSFVGVSAVFAGLIVAGAMIGIGAPELAENIMNLYAVKYAKIGFMSFKKSKFVHVLRRVTCVIFDKTGTLTVNRQAATHAIVDGKIVEFTGASYNPADGSVACAPTKAAELMAAAATLCPIATAGTRDSDGTGLPTDRGLLVAGLKMRAAVSGEDLKALAHRPFPKTAESSGKYSAVKVAGGALVCAGQDWIFRRCSYVMVNDVLSPFSASAYGELVRELSDRRLRLVGCAFLPEADADLLTLGARSDLVLLGVFGFFDPVHPAAAWALPLLQKMGIRIVVASGDFTDILVRILGDIGIDVPSSNVMNGEQLAALVKQLGFDGLVEWVRARGSDPLVFGRVSSEDKERIDRALRTAGEKTLTNGDGANDVGMLHSGTFGLAMGKASQAAKKAAMAKAEDVGAIPRAILASRGIRRNAALVVMKLCSSNCGLLIHLNETLASSEDGMVFKAAVLFLFNLLGDGPAAIALLSNPVSLTEPEEWDPEAPLFGPLDWMMGLSDLITFPLGGYLARRAYAVTGHFAGIPLAADGHDLLLEDEARNPHDYPNVFKNTTECGVVSVKAAMHAPCNAPMITMAAMYIIFAKTSGGFGAVTRTKSIFEVGIFSNTAMLKAAAFNYAVIYVTVYLAEWVFGFEEPSREEVLVAWLLSFLPLFGGEAVKLVRRGWINLTAQVAFNVVAIAFIAAAVENYRRQMIKELPPLVL